MISNRSGSSATSSRITRKLFSSNSRLGVAAAFIVLIFLTGGGSRADIQSLILLRPVAALVLGYGLVTLTREQVRDFVFPFIILGALLLLALLQLIPLPPEAWQAMSGREVLANIDNWLALDGTWRPLTMSPSGTVNAALSLMVPLAALVLVVQLDGRQQAKLLTIVIALGLLSALMGIVQMFGDPRGPLYTFRITNFGSPVGLFANRNHQAIFLSLLVPLMVLWAQTAPGSWAQLQSSRGRRLIIVAAASLVLVALILMTGSRAGIGSLTLALAGSAAMILFRQNKRGVSGSRWAKLGALAAFVAAVVFVIYLLLAQGRGLALDRLLASSAADEGRGFIIPQTIEIISATFPFGTGLGSFAPVYKIYEPDAALSPYYVNHAHSDFAEFAMTGGLLGIIFLVIGTLWLAWVSFRAFANWRGRGSLDIRTAAPLLALWLLVLASLADYPIRTPILSTLAIILIVWISRGIKRSTNATP